MQLAAQTEISGHEDHKDAQNTKAVISPHAEDDFF